jgi:hypothetical protein
MRAAETVEANLQNICGVVSVEKQYKKYVRCVAEKHFNNSILHVSLN